MTIYERIRDLRLQHGMSQDDLAQRVGYTTRSAVCKVESGSRDISQSMIKKYADALNTTPEYLLYGDVAQQTKLSQDEQKLIDLYRSLNPAGQQYLLMTAKMASDNPALSGDKHPSDTAVI